MKKNHITYTTTDSLGNNIKYGVNRFGSWLELVCGPNRRSALYANSPANRERILGEIQSREIKIHSLRAFWLPGQYSREMSSRIKAAAMRPHGRTDESDWGDPDSNNAMPVELP